MIYAITYDYARNYNIYEQVEHVTYVYQRILFQSILSPITDRKTKYTNITTLQYKALRKIFNLHNITYSNHAIIASVWLCNVIYDLFPYQCIMSLLMITQGIITFMSME